MWRVLFCMCLLFSLLSFSPCPTVERTDTSGVIKHPVVGDYEQNQTCGWKIVPFDVDDSAKVVVSFAKLDLVVRNERSDYIEVFDGLDEVHGTLLAVLTGNDTPPPIVASGKTMFIKFEATGADNQTSKGFELDFSVTKCKNDCNGNGYCFNSKCHCDAGFTGDFCSVTECGDCGEEARGKCDVSEEGSKCECVPGFYGGECSASRCSGVTKFTQPSGNFTDHHEVGETNYISNTECQWIIYAPSPSPPASGHQVSFIQLHFNRFSTQAEKDWVHIYDSETAQVSSLLASFSGDIVPVDVVSSTGVMLVLFDTNVGAEFEGFDCSFNTFERSVDLNPTAAPSESKTAAALFATIAFVVGGILGAAFSYFYRPFFGQGEREEEEEEEEEGGREGGFSQRLTNEI